jgi:putative ABC transport system permease protein
MDFGFWRKNNKEKDLDEELHTHLAMAARARVERGETTEDAARAARREFGNAELVKETARDTWNWEWLYRIWVDLRLASRSLAKSPGFCAVVVLTLGLGIGANTAIFTILYQMLLAPLPYKESRNIVQVYSTNQAFKGFHLGNALGDVSEIQKSISGLSDLTVYDVSQKNLTGIGKPQNVDTSLVTNTFFAFFGTFPQKGRFFTDEEQRPGHEAVAVISDLLWRTRFASDPDILCKRVRLDGKDYSVVGVARPEFDFPPRASAVWLPLAPDLQENQDHNNHRHLVLARLGKGATLEQTNRDLLALSERIEKENKNGFGGWRMTAVNLQQFSVEKVRPALLLLFGAVLLVLLIACANVANLLLARGWQRHKEMALRAALGASHWRIVRLLLTETILLALAGGLAGLLIAAWAVVGFRKIAPANTPRLDQLHPDWIMTGFALVCAVLVAVIFGMLPAMQAARWDPHAALKETGAGASPARRKLRDGVAIAEFALALPLLVSAGLLARGFSLLMHTSPGFRLDHVLVLSMDISEEKYPNAVQKNLYARQILEAIGGVAGVDSAALAGAYPLSGNSSLTAGMRLEGAPDSDPGLGNIRNNSVSDGYFTTLGIPILRGRGFTKQDSENSIPVAIVNEAMSKEVWKGRDPVGTRLLGSRGSKVGVLIIGVVGDTHDVSLHEAPGANIYSPISLAPGSSMSLLVRAQGDAAKLAPALQESIWNVDKDQPIEGVQTMQNVVAKSVAQPRFLMILLTTFSILGLTLALIGIYGVISYAVSQRTGEIGVRMALGAQKSNVLQLVIGHGLRITLLGIAIGVAVSLLLTRFLASQLYGVSVHDPWIYSIVVLLLASAAILACYIPARRAMKVDPLGALRYE